MATISCLSCSVRADFPKLAKKISTYFSLGKNKLQLLFLQVTGPDLCVGPAGLGLRPRLGAPRRRQVSNRHDQAWLGLHGPGYLKTCGFPAVACLAKPSESTQYVHPPIAASIARKDRLRHTCSSGLCTAGPTATFLRSHFCRNKICATGCQFREERLSWCSAKQPSQNQMSKMCVCGWGGLAPQVCFFSEKKKLAPF